MSECNSVCIRQGKNGKWYSYLPKEGVEPPKGKQIESVNEEKLKNKIIEYFIGHIACII